MKLDNIPFQRIDWTSLDPTTHPGQTAASATWRTMQTADIRTRIVEYAPGYVADHWCERGHVVFVVEGELITELKDGRAFVTRAGQGYVVSTGDGAHRSRTPTGAKLFIVD
jgi:quercetin dioxygenase-like cupin family protein